MYDVCTLSQALIATCLYKAPKIALGRFVKLPSYPPHRLCIAISPSTLRLQDRWLGACTKWIYHQSNIKKPQAALAHQPLNRTKTLRKCLPQKPKRYAPVRESKLLNRKRDSLSKIKIAIRRIRSKLRAPRRLPNSSLSAHAPPVAVQLKPIASVN